MELDPQEPALGQAGGGVWDEEGATVPVQVLLAIADVRLAAPKLPIRRASHVTMYRVRNAVPGW